MDYYKKRLLKMTLHKALRHSLFLLRDFENRYKLENNEELKQYILLTKDKFYDIINQIKDELKEIELKIKFKKGDKVQFIYANKKIDGIIYNIDHATISYDILANHKILYKNIPQDDIIKTIKEEK